MSQNKIVTCRCGKQFVTYDPPGKPPRTLCAQCTQQARADANLQRMAFAKPLPFV